MKYFRLYITTLMALFLIAFFSIAAMAAEPETYNSGGWGQFFTTTADQGSIKNVSGFDYDGNGFMIGYDRVISDKLSLGVAGGYHSSDITSGTNEESEVGTHIGGFYGSYTAFPYYVDFGALYGRGDINSNREGNTIKSSTDSNSYSLFAEMGYGKHLNDMVVLMPVIGFNASFVNVDGYTENGSTGNEMKISGTNSSFFSSKIGLKSNISISEKLRMKTRTFWTHEFSDDLDEATKGSSIATGNIIKTNGLDVGRDRAMLGVGISYKPQSNFMFDIDYDLELGDEFVSHAGYLTMRKLF